MAEHSPTPWRIADRMNETIVDAQNRVQASAANAETAALIVEAVNERVNLLNALSEEQERGYLLEEERDRLRDLVRRLADALGTFAALEDHEIDLLREAYAALGEEVPE